MIVALNILLGLIAAVAFLFLLFICMPLRFELHLAEGPGRRMSGRVRPFRRFGPGIPIPPRRRKSPDKDSAKPRKRARRTFRPGNIRRFGNAGFRLIADILSKLRIDAANLDLRFGLGDPADTGQAYGQLTPLIFATSAAPRVDIHVEPVFDRAVLAAQGDIQISLVPVRIVGPVLAFLWSVFGPGS